MVRPWLILLLLLGGRAAAVFADDAAANKLAARCTELASQAQAESSIVAAGQGGWLFFTGDLSHVAAIARDPQSQRPDPFAQAVEAIVDFHAQLEAAGIELLLVPVPPKPVIYPDMLVDLKMSDRQPPRLDAGQQALNKRLSDKGVQALDLVPAFLASRAKEGPEIYCKQDTHWSSVGCALAAAEIARYLGDKPDSYGARRTQYNRVTSRIEIEGDLRAALKGPLPPKETVTLFLLSQDGRKAIAPVRDDPGSPIVLLGDSHNLVFHAGGDMHAQGAGLPDQLVHELHFPIDVLAVRGSGGTPARVNLMRKVKADPTYLKGKRLVIWCFASREFTQSQNWLKVPIVPTAAGR